MLDGALKVGDDGDEDAEMGELEVPFNVGNTVHQVQFVANCARWSYRKFCSNIILITQLSFA